MEFCKGDVMNVTLTAACSKDDVLIIGTIHGIALRDGAIGDTIAVAVSGGFKLPAATGAIAQGAACYWNGITKQVVAAAADGVTQIGYAFEAKADADTEIWVKIN